MFSTNTIPTASVVDDDDLRDIPEALQILDWHKLRSRMAFHLDIAVNIVITLDKEAKRKEVRAGILDVCGWMFSSNATREAANKEREEAKELRKVGVNAGVIYLGVALGATTLFWMCEQGLFIKPYQALKAGFSSIGASISAGYTWVKDSLVGLATTLQHTIYGSPKDNSPNDHEKMTQDIAAKTGVRIVSPPPLKETPMATIVPPPRLEETPMATIVPPPRFEETHIATVVPPQPSAPLQTLPMYLQNLSPRQDQEPSDHIKYEGRKVSFKLPRS